MWVNNNFPEDFRHTLPTHVQELMQMATQTQSDPKSRGKTIENFARNWCK